MVKYIIDQIVQDTLSPVNKSSLVGVWLQYVKYEDNDCVKTISAIRAKIMSLVIDKLESFNRNSLRGDVFVPVFFDYLTDKSLLIRCSTKIRYPKKMQVIDKDGYLIICRFMLKNRLVKFIESKRESEVAELAEDVYYYDENVIKLFK